ncbi:MAG: TIM barrel protein [Christensenellales bacterium]|jgi:sugar phosphate isomerase/epimerase
MVKKSASISVQYDSPFSPFSGKHFPQALQWVRDCGFEGVELVVSDPSLLDADAVFKQINIHGLKVSTIATGQAAGLEGLSLTSTSRQVREATRQRLLDHVDFAVCLGGANITIGSLRGKGGGLPLCDELTLLRHELLPVAEYAKRCGITINLEPINRYETCLLNTTQAVYEFLNSLDGLENVGILYDTFHSNIEDTDMIQSIKLYGEKFSHVHFADSNRCLPGEGHTDFVGISRALDCIGYDGYISLEVANNPSPQHIIENAAQSLVFCV